MTKIILASNNKGKIKEVKEICKDMPVEIVSMKEAGIDIDIEENGTTFEENALIKAEAVMKLTGELTIADDSGLEVDYLNKERVYIRQDTWDMIHRMISKIRRLLTALRG